ncbi:Very low-density lipoprotein receptor [Apiospora arundinis]|uniref:Very low-density lipoprotein receptor n=1 Tax=Apiospora arundinis TaxID=335852 RepID=A0ABR2JIP0_9PEZI
MRHISCLLLFFVAAVLGQRFVSPGPSNNPASSNTVYAVGSKFFVAWEDANQTRPLSVVLFQLDKKGALVYPFEYIEQRLTGRESVDWQVATTKDLDMSNQFLLNIFYDGDTKPVAVSSRFNITDSRKPSAASTTLTTSTTSSTSTNAGSPTNPPLSGATSDPPAGATTPATDQPQPSDNNNNNSNSGLSTGAKIGIGIAVPVVALLGIGAGYFLNRCRSQRKQQQQPAPALMWGDGQVPMGQKPSEGPPQTYELGYQDAGMNHNVPAGHELPHEPYNRPQELYSDPAHR